MKSAKRRSGDSRSDALRQRRITTVSACAATGWRAISVDCEWTSTGRVGKPPTLRSRPQPGVCGHLPALPAPSAKPSTVHPSYRRRSLNLIAALRL
ncbi:MAG: hypothetical protein MZV70_40160 [Desulfobacterales bacterium]|nr:hypothetical protein [Desulfobacterales bacterium]